MKAWKQSRICFGVPILLGIYALFFTDTTFSQDESNAIVLENSSHKPMNLDWMFEQDCSQGPYRLLEQDPCKISDSSLETKTSRPIGAKRNTWNFDSSIGNDEANRQLLDHVSDYLIAFDFTRREDKKYIYYEILVYDLDQESLKVKIKDDIIMVTGHRRNSLYRNPSKDHTPILKNDWVPNFRRSLPKPRNVDTSKLSTGYRNNILILRLPKVE